MNIWTTILQSYTDTPRDVKTYTRIKREPQWFYVYGANGNIYIQPAKNHLNCCKMKSTITLKKEEANAVYELYKKYIGGLIPRNEFYQITWNSSYWMGIFKDLGL